MVKMSDVLTSDANNAIEIDENDERKCDPIESNQITTEIIPPADSGLVTNKLEKDNIENEQGDGNHESIEGRDKKEDDTSLDQNNEEINYSGSQEHPITTEENQELRETLDINDNNEKNRPQSVISVEIVDKKADTNPVVDDENQKADPAPDAMQRDSSFVRAVEDEAKKVEQELAPSKAVNQLSTGKKKTKKGIFISYSPDSGFLERKFVVELVKQFKENNLSEDIWFDKDEKNTDSPCWFSHRMEAVERCRAAILVVSDSYLMCPVSVYEGKTLLGRQMSDPASAAKIHMVLFSALLETEMPREYNHLLADMVNLTGIHYKKSLAEKTSVVVGCLMESLEDTASMLTCAPPPQPPDSEFSGEYKKKKISQWSAVDIQEWLFHLGGHLGRPIKEFYRQSFAEEMVDGFLMMAMTDNDMVQYLGIDSRVVRKKIMQNMLHQLDKELKLNDTWHLRARSQRSKANTVYLIYDPADRRLAMNLKSDLQKKGLQIIHHQTLGQSKEEFLQLNGPTMATAQYVLVIFTESTGMSPFVFHEVMFADWLGKKLITAMFKNTWSFLRASLKAVLGDCPAIDFETKMYQESLGVLEYHIKPLRTTPGVVLEQSYLNKMADGLKPFGVLATTMLEGQNGVLNESLHNVFISYQWDMQSKISDVRQMLESHGFHCWADISPAMSTQNIRGGSSISSRSTGHIDTSETLQTQIQRNMKAASVVICCITPKYIQSDNCIKDLTLAETLHKPVLPIMLRFCPWPPEGAPSQVRKILARLAAVDLSNEKLFKQNIPVVLDRVRSHIPQRYK